MDEPLGANSSETSLHSTTPAAAAVGGTTKGKVNHISALRSLGLLHELQVRCAEASEPPRKHSTKVLVSVSTSVFHCMFCAHAILQWQEYVAACVETQQQQEKELGKLKAEKKEVERVRKTLAEREINTSNPNMCVACLHCSITWQACAIDSTATHHVAVLPRCSDTTIGTLAPFYVCRC